MAESSGMGVSNITLPPWPTSGDPRRNCDRFTQKFRDWCEINGWYCSTPPRPEGAADTDDDPPPKWTDKGRAMAAFRSAITEEIEMNVIPSLQLAATELKDPDTMLEKLQGYFSGSEGVLTERAKFLQMHQEQNESVSCWEGRMREQGKRLDYCAICNDQIVRDKFISGCNNDNLQSKLLNKGHRDATTKAINTFSAMVQIARNYEQCQEARAIMKPVNTSCLIGRMTDWNM